MSAGIGPSMRHALLTVSIVASVGIVAGCAEADADSRGLSASSAGSLAAELPGRTSMVRVSNALPGMDGASVTADDIALFGGVDYKAVTPYTEIRDNVTRFRFRSGERDTTVATNSEIMADGSRYTIIALAERNGGVRLRVLHDELVPDVGKVRIRVVHGIRGESDVDVLLQGDEEPIFDNVAFGAEAGYKEIDPVAKGTLVVRGDGSGRLLLRKEMKLVAGHSYTVVVTGDGSKRIDAIIIDDQSVAPTAARP